MSYSCAEGGGRTLMSVSSYDFESYASASSATSAMFKNRVKPIEIY